VTRDPVTVASLVDLLVARDGIGATALALDLVDGGTAPAGILVDVLGPAQEEIGERWHRNELTVADEHAATAIAEQVVGSLTSFRHPHPEGPHIALAGAEGEWHVLPPRLLAESLRADGFHVSFLGPSMPARHLRSFIDTARPDVLAVSCTTPLSLDGVVAFVQVAHDAGIPVLAGGRAIPTERRARALGADLWAPDAAGAGRLLREGLPQRLAEPSADTGGAMALGIDATRWVERSMVALAESFPPMADYDGEQIDRTREDLRHIISFVQAATLVHDDGLFHEFVLWLRDLLEARGVPRVALALSLEALARARPDDGAVVRLLDEAAAALRAGPGA
jgi:methanogenic corrinoid protein MtbC1